MDRGVSNMPSNMHGFSKIGVVARYEALQKKGRVMVMRERDRVRGYESWTRGTYEG